MPRAVTRARGPHRGEQRGRVDGRAASRRRGWPRRCARSHRSPRRSSRSGHAADAARPASGERRAASSPRARARRARARRSRRPSGAGRRARSRRARGRYARVISSQPMPASPVTHGSPASSPSGTACAWRSAAGWSAGSTSRTGSPGSSWRDDALRQAARLRPPLVGQHQVHVAERERGQRLLGLRLDELAAQARRLARERLDRREREVQRHRLERGDPPAARHRAGRRREVRLRERRALEQRLRVLDQHQRRDPSAAGRGRHFSSSGTPASRSSTASCCETADGVNCRASATAATVPRSCSSRSRRRRRRSSTMKRCYRLDTNEPASLLVVRPVTMPA